MAEHVQSVLDQMVPPLRDLMDRGVFSEAETRAIVTRRRESEYLLRRRVARKADFLRYIESELALERLRALRTKKIVRDERRNHQEDHDDKKKRTPAGKNKKLGDFHVQQHIHFIYQRLLRKFRSDVSLHLQYAACCKAMKSFSHLGRVYAEALQVHPRCITLWIEAASHEFFDNITDASNAGGLAGGGSIRSARILLQRGLRLNPHSQELWLQYFSLEFHYIQKIAGRRNVLALGPASKEKVDHAIPKAKQTGDKEQVDSLAVPRVIFRNAIKSIPDKVTFRLRFIDTCRQFPETTVLKDEIMKSIESDFSQDPQAWIARASYLAKQNSESSSSSSDDDDDDSAKNNDDKDHSTEKTDDIGFIAAAKEGDFDADSSGGADQKRRKGTDGSTIVSTAAVDPSNAIMGLLDKATDTIASADMYVLSVEFIRSFMQQLTEQISPSQEDDEEQHSMDVIMELAQFLSHLFEKARTTDVPTSAKLVLEEASFLVETDNLVTAIKLLETWCSTPRTVRESGQSKGDGVATESQAWIQWASLVQEWNNMKQASNEKSFSDPAAIFRRALDYFSMSEPEHLIILVELFQFLLPKNNVANEKTESQKRIDEELRSLFQRIIVLSHGSNYKPQQLGEEDPLQEVWFFIPQLFCEYLRYSFQVGGIQNARWVYDSLLFRSSYIQETSGANVESSIQSFIDDCIALEKKEASSRSKSSKRKMVCKEAKQRLGRIYNVAISIFETESTRSIADSYIRKRDEDVLFA